MGFYRQLVAGLDHAEGLIRTGFLCNQDCGICWQDRAWGRHTPEQVLKDHVRDHLARYKVPREVRPGLWVAAHPGSGEVVWVPGLARAEVAPVSTSTTQVWILTCGPSADPSL